MNEFVWAGEDRLADVLSLWKQGFPSDSEEDIRAFGDTLKGEARPLLLLVEGEARSMAFVIPAQMNGYTVWYVYAAATARAHRGRGYFGDLLRELSHRATKAGVHGLFLRPATPSLFNYYSRFGFKSLFYVNESSCEAKELYVDNNDLQWERVTSDFAANRNRWLSRCGISAVVWSETVTAYAVGLLENGGMLISSKGLVTYSLDGACMNVAELLCEEENVTSVLESLTRHFACQIKTVCRPSKQGENSEAYGMFCATSDVNLQNNEWYMGFSLE